MKEIVILENSANFNPLDLIAIFESNGYDHSEFSKEASSYYDNFRNSDYYSIAKINNKTVGFLQAFSDRDNFATSYLYAIAVHKDYQRIGVGRALMHAFNKKFAHTTTWCIRPYKFTGAAEFLSKFGFEDKSAYYKAMVKKQQPIISDKYTTAENISIIENFPVIDLGEYIQITTSNNVASSPNSPNYMMHKMCQTFDYYSIAKINNKTVGFLQAFSDRDNFATSYLYAIAVHKDYQRIGVGRALMHAFNKKFAHTTTWCIRPYKFTGAAEFLSKFGFEDKSDSFKIYMRRRIVAS